MKIMYKSEDGIYFETREECMEHEAQYADWKGWDSTGMPTNDASCAAFVYFPTNNAAAQYISACQYKDEIFEGIEEGDTGLYAWDEFNQWYKWVEPSLIKFIIKNSNIL